METQSFTWFKAPKGKYRVLQIDQAEKEFTLLATDYITVIKDCDTLEEAYVVMHSLIDPSSERFIYDDQSVCLDSFMPGAGTQ